MLITFSPKHLIQPLAGCRLLVLLHQSLIEKITHDYKACEVLRILMELSRNIEIEMTHKNTRTHKQTNKCHRSGLSFDLCVRACHGRSITLIRPQVCVFTNLSPTPLTPWHFSTTCAHTHTHSHILPFLKPTQTELNTHTYTATWLGEPQGLGLMTNKLSVCTNTSAPQMKYRFSSVPKADGY